MIYFCPSSSDSDEIIDTFAKVNWARFVSFEVHDTVRYFVELSFYQIKRKFVEISLFKNNRNSHPTTEKMVKVNKIFSP